MTQRNGAPGADDLLGRILEAASRIGGDELPGLVAAEAAGFGLRDVVLYVVDYDQTVLVPLTGDPGPAGRLTIDATLGGRAYTSSAPVEGDAEDGDRRLWVPLLNGTDRVGVMACTVDGVDADAQARARRLSMLVAELLIVKSAYSDALVRRRRLREMTLAAELQWSLLPPLTFTAPGVTISGVLQPSYEIGGDTFDFSVNGDLAHVSVLDAMGHGLAACRTAAVALASYRHSRRAGIGLAGTYRAMDEVIAGFYGVDRFVTGLFLELDVPTGCVRWVNAGHPAPLILRGRRVVGELTGGHVLPIGLGDDPSIGQESLEPGDRLVVFTDGVVEARGEDGSFFGQERLVGLVSREAAGGLPTPETLRRLSLAILDHQVGKLQDDATTVILEWAPPDTKVSG